MPIDRMQVLSYNCIHLYSRGVKDDRTLKQNKSFRGK